MEQRWIAQESSNVPPSPRAFAAAAVAAAVSSVE
jgi:hypothetical protein